MSDGKVCWTRTQEKVIGSKKCGILLSAGAGSGKTAVLTERVTRLVMDEKNGIPISRMLIVTFTKAAAGELRDRIRKKLTDAVGDRSTPYLVKQLVDLENAEIDTISAFFYRSVRANAPLLSLPPDVRVGETAAVCAIEKKVMRDVVDDFFDTADSDFEELADCLSSSKDETKLDTVLLELAKTLRGKGVSPEKIAREAFDIENAEDFLDSAPGIFLRERIGELAKHYLFAFGVLLEAVESDEDVMKAYGDNFEFFASYLTALKREAKSGTYATLKKLIDEPIPKLGSLKYKTEDALCFSDLKNRLSDSIKKLRAEVFDAEAPVLQLVIEKSCRISRKIAQVMECYFDRLAKEKRDRGIVDFDDLGLMAKKIFCNEDGGPTRAALELSEKYDCIFVDEYQDTDGIQDAVFSAISTGKSRFMVGDVKQSIYAFRGADPSVFNSYRDRWKSGKDGSGENDCVTVFMRENFRSSKNVIDFANLVSEVMFDGSDTPFETGDRLICSKNGGEDNGKKTEICIVGEDKEAGISGREAECEYVADRIEGMLAREKKDDGTPVTPSDIAVLLRNATHAGEFAAALKRRGIPVSDLATLEFFEQSEVLLVLSILNAIDNPLRDIYLAGTMKSPVFCFTVDDLLKIRRSGSDCPLWHSVLDYCEHGEDRELSGRCSDFVRFIEAYRFESRRMGADRILSSLYQSLSLMWLRDGIGDGVLSGQRIRENLTILYEYARRFEENSFSGLSGFITFLSELAEEKKKSADISSDGMVRIITIHRSKGLEFPDCFLCECDVKFSDKELKKPILLEGDMGLAFRIKDESGLVACNTPMRYAAKESMRRRAVFEEMRVLYVALTRARERMIVTCAAKGDPLEKAKEDWRFYDGYIGSNAVCFADWILPAAMGATESGEDSFFTVIEASYSSVLEVSAQGTSEDAKCEENGLYELYRERFSFDYPFGYLANIPAKLTVSKLKPDILDDDELTGGLESGMRLVAESLKRPIGNIKNAFDGHRNRRRNDAPVPAFMQKDRTVDPAAAGTATHVFLQFCDLKKLCEDPDGELERLVSAGFLDRTMADIVNMDEVRMFKDSEFFSDILDASEIRREFRFNVAIPAAELTSTEYLRERFEKNGDTVTVQGVCDIILRDRKGELILADYKTDRIPEGMDLEDARRMLSERHRDQLNYYKRALEAIYGEEIRRVLVYSLALGDTVDIFLR